MRLLNVRYRLLITVLLENNEPILACDLNRYLEHYKSSFKMIISKTIAFFWHIFGIIDVVIYESNRYLPVRKLYNIHECHPTENLWLNKFGGENINQWLMVVSLCISGIVTILVAQWPEIRQIASEQWHDLEIIQHTHLSHSLLGLAKVPATSFLSQFTILVL